MATPNAVTSLNASQIRGPEWDITWNHGGTSLKSFEIRRSTDGGATWTLYATFLKGDIPLSGSTYTLHGVFRSGLLKVIAIGSKGERSFPNPTVSVSGTSVTFLWLEGMRTKFRRDTGASLFVETESPQFNKSIDVAVFEPLTRDFKVPVFGRVRGREGTIEGNVPPMFGFTAADWETRLNNILARQKSFNRLRLITPRLDMLVALTDDPIMTPKQSDGRAWFVSIPFMEVA